MVHIQQTVECPAQPVCPAKKLLCKTKKDCMQIIFTDCSVGARTFLKKTKYISILTLVQKIPSLSCIFSTNEAITYQLLQKKNLFKFIFEIIFNQLENVCNQAGDLTSNNKGVENPNDVMRL